MKIYLVIAEPEHDNSQVIVAFKDKEKADQLAIACNEYNKTIEYSNWRATQPEKDAWLARNKVWDAAHPAAQWGGGYLITGSFEVTAIELIE